MNADVHLTPARTRVSYTMVLVGESNQEIVQVWAL
jgi:hypothetical protein